MTRSQKLSGSIHQEFKPEFFRTIDWKESKYSKFNE